MEIRLNGGDIDQFTKQVVYITTATDRVFLNLEACIHLGLIPASFPNTSSDTNGLEECEVAMCDCPVRTKPPPMPTKLPYPPHEKDKLKQ